MLFVQYENAADETAIYPGQGQLLGLLYCALGLSGEAGEIANKVKKVLRDNDGELTPEVRDALLDELGDVLWYASQLARECRSSLGHVATLNVVKLHDRKERGTLQGSGDSR